MLLVNRHPMRCHLVKEGRDSFLVQLLVFLAGKVGNPARDPGGRLLMGGAVCNPYQLLGPSSDRPSRVHTARDLAPAELDQPVRNDGVLRPPLPLKAPLLLTAAKQVPREAGPNGNMAAVCQKPGRAPLHGQLCDTYAHPLKQMSMLFLD